MGGGRTRTLRYSLIIATKDRPLLLERALRSVVAQRSVEFELLVVDDSAEEATRETNRGLVASVAGGRQLIAPASERGRSAGRARNRGLAEAQGEFVAFLDDDDEWIDPDYLARADASLRQFEADVHFADQEAVLPSGERKAGPIWIEDLGPALGGSGSRVVSAAALLRSAGFAHLNTTIARRELVWTRLGGFEADLRYEEDRHLYYRLIDGAERIVYSPIVVARHYIPAGTGRESASAKMSEASKAADRLRSSEALLATLHQDFLLARVRQERVWLLKRMAAAAAGTGHHRQAFRHAVAALRGAFGLKWLGYTAWLGLRQMVRG